MKTNFYLIVNNKGTTRTVKTKPSLHWNEISVFIQLELPDQLFKKPQLSANIIVNEDDVQPKIIEPDVIQNIQDAIREHSGVEIKLNVVNDNES